MLFRLLLLSVGLLVGLVPVARVFLRVRLFEGLERYFTCDHFS